MDIENLKDEPICECGGYIVGKYTIDTDQDDDIVIKKIRGVCSECGKTYIYKEYYQYKGCIRAKEGKYL